MKKNISFKTKCFGVFGILAWLLFYLTAIIVIFKDIDIVFSGQKLFYNISGYLFPFPYFEKLAMFYYSLFGFLYFSAGYQTFKGRTSGYFWYLSIGYAHTVIGVISFILFGTFINFISVIFNLVLGLFIITYFSSHEVLKEFNISDKVSKTIFKDFNFLKLFVVSTSAIYIVIISFFVFLYPLGSVELKKTKPNIIEYTGKNLDIFDINFKIPKDYIFADINFEKNNTLYTTLLRNDGKIGILIYDYTYFEKLSNIIGKKFNINNHDDFIRLMFKNKYSLIFQYMKYHKFSNIYKNAEEIIFENKNSSCFLFSGKKENKIIYEYFIFDKTNSNIYNLNFIVMDKNENNRKLFDSIVFNSYVNKPFYKKNYHELSLQNYLNNNLEQLKYSVANALEVDPNNSDLLYMLAYAFYKDNRFKNKDVAKELLNRSLNFNSEHNQSIELLRLIGDI
ncbi:MAG: hypothetical protein M0R46_04765 [Candidatus Muirbacterium halophilum]|nr:hypothetical protein [Candidatus Muirbacterium halophilum]MCK9475208.1 hypothetical protein [Candidatus Muirbacterium halophilum]